MKKIFLFSFFLLSGLIISQVLPPVLGDQYYAIKLVLDNLMFICLAYIMINVGREFELDKYHWKNYINDFFIAMATASVPWILVAIYFMLLLPAAYFGNWDAWKENLLLSCFAAPTSAGILFTMLAAAGLRQAWIYKKAQVLAIFDDLGTILLLIPLQIFMVGMKWQLFIVVFIILGLLYLGWSKLGKYNMNQSGVMLLIYSVLIVSFCSGFYFITKQLFGPDGGVHLEVLLPAFVLGMIMKTTHHYPGNNCIEKSNKYKDRINYLICKMTHPSKHEETISDVVSYIFMFLVGISTPLFITGSMDGEQGNSLSITASQPMMSWGMIALHVVIITVISNIGKMVPLLFYRDRQTLERLALSIGMFTRGEVGAGIIIIALGYNLGGPIMIIAILSLVLNLLLTGGFVLLVKRFALKVYQNPENKIVTE